MIYFPLSLILTVICYVTNPLVLLFCNDDGELSGLLHLWQTWDNSCNPSDITHIAPDWLQYGWKDHYTEYRDTTQYLRSVNRDRWFTVCCNPNFTLIERLKRYICRCIWLTRNNCYGWAFYVLGHTAVPPIDVETSENTISAKEKNGSGWMYKNEAPIFTLFGWTVHWNNLLGWKLDTDAKFDTRSMIANRIAFFFKREGEE
jgi:hypothetical protein